MSRDRAFINSAIQTTGVLIDKSISTIVTAALARPEWAEGSRPDARTVWQHLRENDSEELESCVRLLVTVGVVARQRGRRRRVTEDDAWALLQECFEDTWSDRTSTPDLLLCANR
jgi:hypothetical protein